MVFKKVLWLCLVTSLFLIIACAPKKKETVLQHVLEDGAQVEKVEFKHGTVRKESTVKVLTASVTIKNTSNAAKRYKCDIWIPGIGAGQDFAPASHQKKIEPGQTDVSTISIVTDETWIPETGKYQLRIAVDPFSNK